MTTVTLRDVAEAAGVSVRTVSNVVNHSPQVSERTRRKVQAHIDAMGYRPNPIARSLKRGRSNMIALLVPDVENPYFGDLVRLLNLEVTNRGYSLLISQTEGEASLETRALYALHSRFFDGVIVNPLGVSQESLRELVSQIPVAILGEEPEPGFDHVLIDNVAAARTMTEHFLETGRRRVAFVGAPTAPGEHATSNLRAEGYESAIRDAGLTIVPEYLVAGTHYTRAMGASSVARLMSLPEPPDAIFCANDLLAIGVIHGLTAAGLRVPIDVAVGGIDDIEEGRYGVIPLTTISPNKRQIAHAVTDLLFKRILHPDRESERILASWELIVRGSSMPPIDTRPRARSGQARYQDAPHYLEDWKN